MTSASFTRRQAAVECEEHHCGCLRQGRRREVDHRGQSGTDIPILGVVENMSMHVCSNCGHAEPIFGEGGEKICAEYGVEFLGALPLAMSIREQADSGKPTMVADPYGPVAEIYRNIARKVAVGVAMTSKFPSIVVKND